MLNKLNKLQILGIKKVEQIWRLNVKINWVDFIEMQIAGLTTVDLGQCALSQQAKQIDPEITGATIWFVRINKYFCSNKWRQTNMPTAKTIDLKIAGCNSIFQTYNKQTTKETRPFDKMSVLGVLPSPNYVVFFTGALHYGVKVEI